MHFHPVRDPCMAHQGSIYSLARSRVISPKACSLWSFTRRSVSNNRATHNNISTCGRFASSVQTWQNCRFWINRSLEVSQKLRISTGILSYSDIVKRLTVMALQRPGGTSRRLIDVVRALPKVSKAYFKSPFRRALYGGIAMLVGFYVAQTISRSFGALAVNDVIAATFCVLLAEYVTKFYHSRTRVSFSIALLNSFKMGFTYGLFIDAFELAS